jgi:hypothetical protein
MSYSPTLGRWAETDPAEYIDGPNLYQMELDNPVTYVDPTGLSTDITTDDDIRRARADARAEGKAYVEYDYTEQINYPNGAGYDRTTYSFSIPNATPIPRFTNKNTEQYQCKGGSAQANKDFDDIVKSAKVENKVKKSSDSKVRYVILPHGSLMTIYDSSSSTGEPTIIINGQEGGPGTTKVRYGP